VLCMLLLLPVAATATGRSDEPAPVLYFPAAFTAAECSSIARIFTEGASLEVDERSIPNLPRMADDYGVARLNRFDEGGRLQAAGALDWVYERVAAHLSPAMATRVLGGHGGGGERSSTAQRLGSLVEFSLMHEFDERHSRFDWHVDTKPRDGTRRTFNVNVMLSAGGDYSGGELRLGAQTFPRPFQDLSWNLPATGELRLGAQTLRPQQGDLYLYAASLPHAVARVSGGRRRTLVVALRQGQGEEAEAAAEAEVAAAEAEVAARPDAPLERAAYWAETAEAYAALLSPGGGLATEPKVHLLHGEFLEALGAPHAARGAFCSSYRASDEAHAYAEAFMADGVAALSDAAQPSPLQRHELALSYLGMAHCIAPATPELKEGLAAVRRARDALLRGADGPPGDEGTVKQEL